MNCKICQLPLEISKQYSRYYGCPIPPDSPWYYKNHYLKSIQGSREHFLIEDIFISSYSECPSYFIIRDYNYYLNTGGFIFRYDFSFDFLKIKEYSKQKIMSKIKTYQLYV